MESNVVRMILIDISAGRDGSGDDDDDDDDDDDITYG